MSNVRVTVVRCPLCGSTDAGEDGAVYEFTLMRCASCGHSAHCDHYAIKDDWNVEIDVEEGTGIPPRVPPLEREEG